MHSIIRTPEAEQDLLNIWEFIADDNLAAADRLLALFTERFSLLAHNPLLGAACAEIDAELRFLIVGSYVAYYSVGEDSVTVLKILHGARDVTAIFRQR